MVYNQKSYTTPNRKLTSQNNTWTTINANVYITDPVDYDTVVKGLRPRLYWATDGILQVDDLKFGYATEVEVFRNNASIYRGYLSDYDDTAAIDNAKPNTPSGVSVGVGTGRKPTVTWSPAADNGTTYSYQIKGYPKNSGATALSAAKQVTVTSGIKGYSVVIDQSPTTIPDTTIETTGTSYTGPATVNGNFYVHVAAIDNQGNMSSVAHIPYTDTEPPTLTLVPDTTSWTNGQVVIQATADDLQTGFKRLRLPDGNWVSQSLTQYTILENGTYTFVAEDNVGNQVEKSIVVNNIDKGLPTVSVTPNGHPWTSNDIAVQVEVSDAESGLKPNGIYYKVTQSTTVPTDWELLSDPSQPVTLSQEGQWFIHVKATDQAGNTSQVVSQPYQIQYEPNIPENFQTTNIQHDQITLSWDLPAGTVYTDGYKYELRNTVTGATYQVDYPENQVVDGSVSGGREYHYELTVRNHVGQATTQLLSVLTKPDAPVFKVYKIGRDYSQAEMVIDPVLGADQYHVVVKDAFGSVIIDEYISGTSHKLEGLQAGTSYSIAVSGVNNSGEGPAMGGSFLSLPDVPGGFSAVQIQENSVDLTWNSVTSATYYNLERNLQSVFNGPDLSFSDTNLESGTVYDYRLSAGNETGEGDFSELPGIITLPGALPLDTTTTEDSITVRWSRVRGADSYTLMLSDGQTVTLPAGVLEYTFSGLASGQAYEVTAYAQNRSGQGVTSTVSSFTLPEAPDAITVTNIEETSAELSWEEVPGATKYRVTVGDQAYEVSTNHLALNTLQGSEVYNLTVEAGNSSGYGAATSGQFLTKPHAVSNLKVRSVQTDSIVLSWDADATASGYYAQLDGAGTAELTNQNEIELRSLEPGKTYGITVWSENPSGESRKTRIEATTQTLPVAADGIQVKVEPNQVAIEFEPVDGAKEYVLKDENGTEIWRGETGPIVLAPITPGTNYGYEIVAENSQGYGSEPTPIEFVTIPAKPEGIVLGTVTETTAEFDLSQAVLTGATELIMHRDGKEIKRVPVTTTLKDEGLKPNTSYTYMFQAANASGESPEMVEMTVKTKEHVVSGGGGGGSTPPLVSMPEPTKPDKQENHVPDPEQGGGDASQNPAPTQKFEDVKPDSFARKAIDYLAEKQIVKGVTDKMFEPDRPISRVEFAALIVRATQAGPDNTLELTYKDINKAGWYMTELKAAIANEIAVGFSKTEFRPMADIDREQAAKMLGNVILRKSGIGVGEVTVNFSDNGEVSTWAKETVRVLSALKILEGYPDGTFRPKGKLSRAESAVLIYRLMQLQN
ncbi:fibronectin type III domain-containing protein [Bacillus sp. FSL K6-6540]|uniref:fibronectin type III domain-containing protein n=1 Tax=Bacillus sp. FSL K6-6540 TaxID=2921512 RepID=UPI0030FC7355